MDGCFQLDSIMAGQVNQSSGGAESAPAAMAPVLGCTTWTQQLGTAPAWLPAPLCPSA